MTVRPSSCIYDSDLEPPKVFISSTFEDRLLEIRAQLRITLEASELRPVMSELDSFSSTGDRLYEDTIAAVRGCQLFVLLLGHRYGTRHPILGKSITHLEYEAARDAGIRTLVYVEASLWELFHDRTNEPGTAAPGSEREDAFDLLEQIAGKDNCRCVPFVSAEEITTNLKHQLANLLGAYLRFQQKAADWVWTKRYTREIESSADVVWILTPDLYWDYADAEFNRLVCENVTRRRARYFYLFREDRRSNGHVEEMIGQYEEAIGGSWRDFVFFAAIPEEEFFWCAEQVLYNPADPHRERAILVDTMDGRNKEYEFDVELGRGRRSQFRAHFEELWSAYSDQTLIACDQGLAR